MINFFKKIRKSIITDEKNGKPSFISSRYLKYAVGEIVLVMIGILLALQVNNWNIQKSDAKRENKYLANIVLDLQKDIKRLDYLISFRKERLIGDQKLIQFMNGLPIQNLTETTKFVVNSLMEENFTPNNSTFLELSNSGNLNLIANDSIKILLLELEELYKINRLGIEHETFDYREYISKSAINLIEIDQLFPVYLGTKTIENQKITSKTFEDLFKSREYKNGLFITIFMSNIFILEYQKMKKKSEKIIQLIKQKK